MPFTDCTPPMQKFLKITFLLREPLLVYGIPKTNRGGGIRFLIIFLRFYKKSQQN